MNSYFYTYIITNLVNGKFYVGKTNNPEKRWTLHKNYAKNTSLDPKFNYPIYKGIRKYGIINFTIGRALEPVKPSQFLILNGLLFENNQVDLDKLMGDLIGGYSIIDQLSVLFQEISCQISSRYILQKE